jgi:hypothetical protein
MILGLRPGPLGEGAAWAEAAGLDFVLLGGRSDPEQAPIGQDALSVAAFLMTSTRRIGLAACVPTTWAPFNVARALASFDRLSGGRCGWLPWPGPGADDGPRFAEHLDVVMQLFDSWDDDALVLDKPSGVFADRDKVRRIRHEGTFYTVDGPLNAPRPLQGYPVLFQPLAQATTLTDVALVDWETLPLGSRLATPAALLLAEVGVSADPDALADAYEAGRCDGFVLAAADPQAVEPVLVRLRARGLAMRSNVSGDFRTQLGLDRPPNRFTAASRP